MNPTGLCLINPGSATIKWQLDGGETGQVPVTESRALFQRLAALPCRARVVRVVHGGAGFYRPLPVGRQTLARLESTRELAPLHNGVSLECLRILLEVDGSVPVIAVFDTEFFHDLPAVAQHYAVPLALQRRYGIRRYGFHGFAHQAMQDFSRRQGDGERVVTIQLGSGCSMAAIHNGRPIDTSMGFTPNEGLLMRTRSGDIDAGLVTFLQRHEGWDAARTDQVLNERSGWAGLAGSDSDGGLQQAAVRELFVWRIRKTLGAYFAVLGGLDAVIFSGGVAEHDLSLCHEIVAPLSHLGIRVAAPPQQKTLVTAAACLSVDDSPVSCRVMGGDEFSAMRASVARSGVLTEQGG